MSRLVDIVMAGVVFLRVGGDAFSRVESNGLGVRLFVGGDLSAVPWMFLSVFLLVGAFLLVRHMREELGSIVAVAEGVVVVGAVVAICGYLWGAWTAIRFLAAG